MQAEQVLELGGDFDEGLAEDGAGGEVLTEDTGRRESEETSRLW